MQEILQFKNNIGIFKKTSGFTGGPYIIECVVYKVC